MSLWKRAAAAAACAALFAAAAPAASEEPLPPVARPTADPAVKRGALPNGLRYAFLHNATPAGAVSIRLVMDVGSYQEEEAERGFAHFIEHMAFRSTREAPQGVLDNRFAALGIALGRDQNAVTTPQWTLYSVDLPSAEPRRVRTVLDWMRGAADGILFTPAGVDVERGVVLAEKDARNSPMAEMQQEIARFQGGGLRSTQREPIGTEATLRAATPAALRAFYDRWYRPERATLVIVGDASVAEMERLATESFATWAARGPAPADPATPPLAKRGLEAFTRSSEVLPAATSACTVSAPDEDRSESIARLRRDTYTQLWTAILNKRLNHLSQTPGSKLLGAAVLANRDLPDATMACLISLPNGKDWKSALAAAQSEWRRFADAGPTEAELAAGIEELRSQLRGQAYVGATRDSTSLAAQIAAAAIEHRVFQSPEDAMTNFDQMVEGMTPADVKRAFDADWSGSGPLIVTVAAEAPSAEELLAAWKSNTQASALAAYTDRQQDRWTYSFFGKPGKVARREQRTDPDYRRITFRNGVVLNFRQTDFESGSADIRIRFGSGERTLAPDERLVAAMGAGAFPYGGLGKLDYEQLSSALAGNAWPFALSVGSDSFILSSSTLSDNVPLEMQVLAAFMTDPGFRPLIDEKLPAGLEITYRLLRTDPNAAAVDAMERALFPDQLSIPAPDRAAAFRSSEFRRLLRPALVSAPLEVTIVGDLTEKQAVRAVAQTFGALPPRAAAIEPQGQGPFRRFPEETPAPIAATHQGPAEKAAALMIWPTYVATPVRRREEYAIALASSIFQTRLIQRIRGEMGKVYSPSVGSTMPDFADQGYVAAAIETTPADLDTVLAAAKAVAADLSAGQITQEEVDRAREPLVAQRLQAKRRNAAWAGVISGAARHPEALDELFGYEAALKALTLEDVRTAAATWLAKQPILVTARPAAARGAAAGAR